MGIGRRHWILRPGDKMHGEVGDPCVYCGVLSSCWEHVIPYCMVTPTLIVRACNECNHYAGSQVFDTIIHKCIAIQESLAKKYKKFILRERMTDDEKVPLSYKLRRMVTDADRLGDLINERLAWTVPPEVVDAYEAFMLEKARKRQRPQAEEAA